MLLVDHQIRDLCSWGESDKWMITPFSEKVTGNGIISYGLSHSGYDMRLADDEFLFFNALGVMDPKLVGDEDYRRKMFNKYPQREGNALLIPPHSYFLARSLEWFNIPRDIAAIAVGKSTYARCGIILNTTPLESGWKGQLTLEIGNITPCPAKVYVGEGIGQVLFFRLDGAPERDYGECGGKYQNQLGVTPARVQP